MTIVQTGLLLAVLMPFVLAAWIAFRHRHRSTTEQDFVTYTTFEDGLDGPVEQCFAVVPADLNVVLREAVLALNSLAHSSWVRIESAVEAALLVPMNVNAVRTALYDALRSAIDASPGGQVLVTAITSGSQVHIRITDDGPGTDQQVRETSMREVENLLALQGGSVRVEARPGHGTTVTIAAQMLTAADEPVSAPVQLPALVDEAV